MLQTVHHSCFVFLFTILFSHSPLIHQAVQGTLEGLQPGLELSLVLKHEVLKRAARW